MPRIVALDEIPAERRNVRGSTAPGSPAALSTSFFRATKDTPDAPTAAMQRYDKAALSSAHFHQVDQFQVIVEGSGEFGRHHVAPYHVHFSRAWTPYGPLLADKDTGWAFIVMRSRFDPGAQRLPNSLDKLKAVQNRTPWQVTAKADFPERTSDVNVHDVAEISDEHGLYTRTVAMAPNARMRTPDRQGGDGQYVVVVKGSIVFDGAERNAPTVLFLDRNDAPVELVAGGEGLEALILNFPKAGVHEEVKAPETQAGFKTWQCVLCAFVYDEEAGWPDEGIPPGTRWADVPDTWTCPDCSATKADFEMIEI